MFVYLTYPLDTRIIDPSVDGHPIVNEMGPYFHIEPFHMVKWPMSEPSKAKTVFGDRQALVFRNNKTEKLIPHIPIPLLAGPGLALTILQKSKCHIYFHNPNLLIEKSQAAVNFPLLAPPLHCAMIRLPLPPILKRLALKAKQAKALKVAKDSKALGKAIKRLQDVNDKLYKLESFADYAGQATGLTSPMKHFENMAKNFEEKRKAEDDLDKVIGNKGLREAWEAEDQYNRSKELEAVPVNEMILGEEEKEARREQQNQEREQRKQQKAKEEEDKQAKEQEKLQEKRQEEAKKAREDADASDSDARDDQQQADEHRKKSLEEQRKQQAHQQQSQQSHQEAQKADEHALKAEKRRQDHETDARTAESIGEYDKEQGRPIRSAQEEADAERHREAAKQAELERDQAEEQAKQKREQAREHDEEAKVAGAEAASASQNAQEKQQSANDHRKQAQASRHKAQQAEQAAKQHEQQGREARSRAAKAGQEAEQAKLKAREANKRAEQAKEKRKAAKRGRLKLKKKVLQALCPTCEILLPSLTSFIATFWMHTVICPMSLMKLLKLWAKVAAIIAADIVDGYLGFITDSLTSMMGKGVKKWALETFGATLKGTVGGSLRSWGTNDTLVIKVPTKVGCVSSQFEYEYKPEDGSSGWKVSGEAEIKVGESKSKVGGSYGEKSNADGSREESSEFKAENDFAKIEQQDSTTHNADGSQESKASVKGQVGEIKGSSEYEKKTTVDSQGNTSTTEKTKNSVKVGEAPIDLYDFGNGATPMVP